LANIGPPGLWFGSGFGFECECELELELGPDPEEEGIRGGKRWCGLVEDDEDDAGVDRGSGELSC